MSDHPHAVVMRRALQAFERTRALLGRARREVKRGRRERRVRALERRIARLLDAYENGWLDKHEFEPRVRSAKWWPR